MAKQAAGSVLVQHGETVILAAVTVSDKRSNLPFFPLTVEFRERTYAAGKFLGEHSRHVLGCVRICW